MVLTLIGSSNLPLGDLVVYSAFGRLINFKSRLSRVGNLGVIGKYEDSTELCHIVNVYSPCNYKEKRQVWLDLGQWKNESPNNLWCFAGDFNSVKCNEEHKGRESHGRKKEMFDFSCFINNLELLDLPLVGRRFTWFKGDGKTMSRLDRFLLSSTWPINGQIWCKRVSSEWFLIIVRWFFRISIGIGSKTFPCAQRLVRT
ncbi:putative endonuclease/exonuclease/phosphatase [Lupinus albus]|uniref:Putative endonuclease/exonuclease/phosphatase n=1 Tax=Lupinus albus TaxID=3870 RepID=A0A6A4PEA9_LUPAL|nr:putative endonuclease/exonuclease/phosphatase [Lupinus albus]